MQLKVNSFVFFILLANISFAQIANDECLNAIQITDTNEWCSNPGQFTSVGSTDSDNSPFCFPMAEDQFDVWFYFTAIANAINVSVIGDIDQNSGGSMVAPQLAVYSGDCLNGLTEIACFSDAFGNDFAETFLTELTPGENYYIQVSALNENTGTFQLCINNFNSPPEPDGDCVTGVVLCDKNSFSVDYVLGGGNDITEVDGASCLEDCGSTDETSSAWYKWICEQSGTLTFSISPNNPDDDLDFLVYELPNGIDNCNGKIELRCMASGGNIGEPVSEWINCTGPTGAVAGDADQGEGCGCDPGDNNFVAPIDMIAGRSYALIVNNFSNSSSGFSISWGGTGTFLGPEVDFSLNIDINMIECDESILVTDASSFNGGNIVGWTWSFGPGATPSNDFTPNPPPVSFESFGPKFVTLTVESDGGCFVTKTIPLNVNECCVSPSDLRLDLIQALDPICANEATGSISVEGFNGDPDYLFSINNGPTLPYPVFTNLTAGSYDILIQDIKGCQDIITVDLFDPPAIFVDAGPDITIDLGESVNLNAIAIPNGSIAGYDWDNETTLSCEDCPNPTAMPFSTTDYNVVAFNDLGCEGEDRVLVMVRDIRPIYIPNVISPNDDGQNDRFHIFGNDAALEITLLRIFNRWGAAVYEERNLPLGENSHGWDGTFNGQQLNSDVFAFYAIIKFIDNKEILYEGDITIMR